MTPVMIRSIFPLFFPNIYNEIISNRVFSIMPRRKPNKLQRVVYSIPFLAILVGLTVVVAISAWNMYQTNQETEETVERLRTEHQELSQREDVVTDEALNISTERGLEEEIREKFSVAKEGERVIVLVDDQDQATTTTDTEPSWWQELLAHIWPF